MITIVSRWEHRQMPPEVEWLLWRQLKNFGISRFIFVPVAPELQNVTIEQYDTMEEALSQVSTKNRVFLESTGSKGMHDLPPRDEDVIFILGNTSTGNARYAEPDEMYRINEPRVSDMFPTSAIAIALAFWVGQ